MALLLAVVVVMQGIVPRVVSAAAARPGGAWYNELSAEARAHFALGLRYFSTQQYQQAVAEFRDAYVHEPHPKILYTLGQTYRLAGDCTRAIEAYKAFLGSQPPADLAKLAAENITRCNASLSAASAAPAPTPVASVPTPTAVAATGPLASSAAVPRAAVSLPAAATPWYLDVAGDALLAAGVIGLGTSAGAYAVERQSRAAMRDASDYGDYERHLTRASTARHVELYAVASATVLIAAAVTRYLMRSTEVEPTANQRVVTGK